MPNYQRARVPGGTFFFTVVTHRRRHLFHRSSNRAMIGHAFRSVQQTKPFHVNAIVVLPDHLHAIWTLPAGDDDYSRRWGAIKRRFTSEFLQNNGVDHAVSVGKARDRRRGVWQRRFWEHTIESEAEFENHFD